MFQHEPNFKKQAEEEEKGGEEEGERGKGEEAKKERGRRGVHALIKKESQNSPFCPIPNPFPTTRVPMHV